MTQRMTDQQPHNADRKTQNLESDETPPEKKYIISAIVHLAGLCLLVASFFVDAMDTKGFLTGSGCMMLYLALLIKTRNSQ